MRLLAEALALIGLTGGGYSLLRLALTGRQDSVVHVRVNGKDDVLVGEVTVTTTVTRPDDAGKEASR